MLFAAPSTTLTHVSSAQHIVVIGAGIVGACCALELLSRGYRVTIIDAAKPGGEQAASYGNGAWISPASVVPMSMPGLWKQLPRYLFSPSSPLRIRWQYLPTLLPWLWRFMWAGSTPAKVQSTAASLSALLHDAPQRHSVLAQRAGVPHLIVRRGLIMAYPNRTAFEAEALAWQLRAANGVKWQELNAAALREAAPHLSARYGFGVHLLQGAHCLDPGAYTAALVAQACKQGTQFRNALATDFNTSSDLSVQTMQGDIACDGIVICAGIASKALAQAAGDTVCLESERGYHVQLPHAHIELSTPVMPCDGKMANTLTLGGLRAAGQVELASSAAAPDWSRANRLLKHIVNTYDGLHGQALHGVQRWMGHRPSTPHGLPIIDMASASNRIVYAFGHGHVGFASAPSTAQRVADLMEGGAPDARYAKA